MLLAEGLFVDLDSPSIKRLRLGVPAQVFKQSGKIVVRRRNVRVIIAENLFVNLDRRRGVPQAQGGVVGPEQDARLVLRQHGAADRSSVLHLMRIETSGTHRSR